MFSKSCEYAIKAVIFIAKNHIEHNTFVGVKAIAKGIDAPEHFVGKILQILVKNKIILSIKGPKGGFSITDAQQKQPIFDIVKLMDGDKLLIKCVLGLNECSDLDPCPMHHDFHLIKQQISNMLINNTIEGFNLSVLFNQSRLK